MDVLMPDLIWIEGRCYRQFYRSFVKKKNTLNDDIVPNYTEDNEMSCKGGEYDQEEFLDEFTVTPVSNGKYQALLSIPRIFFGSIIGPKGSIRQRLEEETKTQIRVPSKSSDGDVVITGSEEQGIKSACRRIELIVASARHKQQFTHFLSIPVASKQIQSNFLQFKDEICKRFINHRIDESIFQSPEKLHLTLGTMVLGNPKEEKKIADMLQVFKETYVDPLLFNKSLHLRMLGVEYMNDDPREVDVLYGKVELADGSSILQLLANDLVEYFQGKGFMTKQYEKVKLHVTLMNTLFRDAQTPENASNSSARSGKIRETFDASEILKVYENFNFGDLTVDSIHLSLRYSTGANGYYKMITSLKLK